MAIHKTAIMVSAGTREEGPHPYTFQLEDGSRISMLLADDQIRLLHMVTQQHLDLAQARAINNVEQFPKLRALLAADD